MSGAGSLQFSKLTISQLDPAAYARVIAGTGEDASESEASRLQSRLNEALDRGSWALGDLSTPFTIAAGLARLQPLSFDSNGLRAQASGFVDLRALTADLRLNLRPLGAMPKGWPGDAPQIGIAWRGPVTDLKREADVGALANTVAARALAREIERVEAFEADARERAIHSRRLRAEREMRENERKLQEFIKAEDERKAAEEKRAEEARLAEEAKRAAEEAKRAAEERRADEQRRAAEARQEQEARRRAEAEERARAAAERAGAAATAWPHGAARCGSAVLSRCSGGGGGAAARPAADHPVRAAPALAQRPVELTLQRDRSSQADSSPSNPARRIDANRLFRLIDCCAQPARDNAPGRAGAGPRRD